MTKPSDLLAMIRGTYRPPKPVTVSVRPASPWSTSLMATSPTKVSFTYREVNGLLVAFPA